MTNALNIFMKFRAFFEAINTKYLTTTDIYDFYFLTTALSYDQIHSEDLSVAEFYLNDICQLYLQSFKQLLIDQIEKYYKRNRVDADFSYYSLKTANFEKIKELINKTFRSDMVRRNDVWNLIAANLLNLSKAGSIKIKCFYMDRLNNCVHNTGDLVLDKFPNGYKLMNAFDIVHNSKTPKEFARFVSPEIRKLMKIWR